MPAGVVVAFERGRGRIDADGRHLSFHATQLANGSRSIAVGTRVEFEIAPGLPGEWEAIRVTPRADSA